MKMLDKSGNIPSNDGETLSCGVLKVGDFCEMFPELEIFEGLRVFEGNLPPTIYKILYY